MSKAACFSRLSHSCTSFSLPTASWHLGALLRWTPAPSSCVLQVVAEVPQQIGLLHDGGSQPLPLARYTSLPIASSPSPGARRHASSPRPSSLGRCPTFASKSRRRTSAQILPSSPPPVPRGPDSSTEQIHHPPPCSSSRTMQKLQCIYKCLLFHGRSSDISMHVPLDWLEAWMSAFL